MFTTFLSALIIYFIILLFQEYQDAYRKAVMESGNENRY